MDRIHLVDLDRDHPGFRDATYRARRDAIARIALDHVSGAPVPDAPYTAAEHGVWRTVRAALEPLHTRLVARALRDVADLLDLPRDHIPQLAEVNARLAARTDFRMEPVAGLVTPHIFLMHLGRGTFLSTQYIRHASKPLYTPEPDVLHELVGHAASLVHPALAATSRRFGQLAAGASETELERLTRVYWYTLEFGLVEEDGALRALGAGLLSSVGELRRSIEGEDAAHEPLDLDALADRPYDPTAFQPVYAVGPGVDGTLAALDAWLDAGAWRDHGREKHYSSGDTTR